MTVQTGQPPALLETISYPDSDGKPMADNTLQYRWIEKLKGNIELRYVDDPNVFVAGDLLWYPVQGHPEIRTAPDVLVAIGRPKGDRGSYRQWAEAGIAPQIVFEVLSPGNRHGEMMDKVLFYDRYGVEEYYIYNPDRFEFDVLIRQNDRLTSVSIQNEWISPRMGIRFVAHERAELEVFYPDGRPFLTMTELGLLAEQRQRAIEAEQQRANAAEERAAKLAAKLQALGIEPDL